MSHQSIKCLVLAFILSANFSQIYTQSENATEPEVTYPQGTVKGTIMASRNNRNYSAFLGIPFAEPPIGDLRFSSPVAAGSWNGTRDCTVDSNMCPQISDGENVGEEDCLYINVYTPKLPENTSSSLLPTMVFIYGGAFKEGTGRSSMENPAYFLDKDLVLVTFNYRLGPFGFLSTGDEVASGNWGLKDQVLALRWVQDNIEYFGGDPDQVTLFGQSAGSTSTHLLSLSNATIGLFHRFISQSGSALGTWAQRPRAAYANLAYQLGGYVGCSNDTSEALISCLRKVNFTDILSNYSHFFTWYDYPTDPWGPTIELDIEGALLTDTPENLYAAGNIRDLAWIVGITRDEGAFDTAAIYENEALFNEFFENFDAIIPTMLTYYYQSDGGAAWVKAIKSYYFNDDFTANSSVLLANLTMFIGDSHFLYPTYNAIRKQSALAKNPQYFYSFNYRGTFSNTIIYGGSEENYGVSHADDMIYLFPCAILFPECIKYEMSETDNVMIDTMIELWTSFAINGTPTSSALNGAAWIPYSQSEENFLRIGNEYDAEISVEQFAFQERMKFWDGLYALLENSNVTSDTSAAISWTSNLFFVLLFASLKFLPSVTTESML